MPEHIIQHPAQGLRLGGYPFTHGGYYNAAGSYVVAADTQEHLNQILADIEADTLPLPAFQEDATDALLAETALALLDSDARIDELEAIVAALAAESLGQ